MTLRPMPPTPMTTADWPWVALARLNTAPTPVSDAQPMRQADVERHVVVDHDGLGLVDDRVLGEHAGVGELERLARRRR